MNEPKANQSSEANRAERRGFIQFATGALSAFIGMIPASIGAVFLLDPILKTRRKTLGRATNGADDRPVVDGGEGEFVPLGISIDAIPSDGTPLAVKVKADLTDAWNRFKDVEVGTVWLRRTSKNKVVAFSSICPHLGCAVDFRSSKGDFFCPCHTSSFDLDGERTNQIPPRGMDQLKTKTMSETGDELWIKYESYRAGTPDKIKTS